MRSRLTALARTPDLYGLIHGDFETDNLAWTGQRITAFDWDEAERSWFAADIAHAVRDLVTDPLDLVDTPIPLLDAFLDGYQQRAEAQVTREQLVLFTAMNARRSLSRVLPVLSQDPAAGRDLAARKASDGSAPVLLRTVVEKYAERQRTIASQLAALLQ